jgi:hypothetical protein
MGTSGLAITTEDGPDTARTHHRQAGHRSRACGTGGLRRRIRGCCGADQHVIARGGGLLLAPVRGARLLGQQVRKKIGHFVDRKWASQASAKLKAILERVGHTWRADGTGAGQPICSLQNTSLGVLETDHGSCLNCSTVKQRHDLLRCHDCRSACQAVEPKVQQPLAAPSAALPPLKHSSSTTSYIYAVASCQWHG